MKGGKKRANGLTWLARAWKIWLCINQAREPACGWEMKMGVNRQRLSKFTPADDGRCALLVLGGISYCFWQSVAWMRDHVEENIHVGLRASPLVSSRDLIKGPSLPDSVATFVLYYYGPC